MLSENMFCISYKVFEFMHVSLPEFLLISILKKVNEIKDKISFKLRVRNSSHKKLLPRSVGFDSKQNKNDNV